MMEAWVILVGGGYGGFMFSGSESDAERMRAHKANWERAVAIKRRATPEEVAAGVFSPCWNHPGFVLPKGHRLSYVCDCGECSSDEGGEE